VSSTYSASEQQLFLDVDRGRAELLGVPVPNVYQELQAYYGSASCLNLRSTPHMAGDHAVRRAVPRQSRRLQPDIPKVGRRQECACVGHSHHKICAGPNILTRFNGFPAAKISGNAAHGYSSGQALRAMEEVARETLPEGFGYEWSGQAYEEKKAGGTSSLAFVFGLIVVFLILAAQYEKWTAASCV
jgi:multidrug efflux pump